MSLGENKLRGIITSESLVDFFPASSIKLSQFNAFKSSILQGKKTIVCKIVEKHIMELLQRWKNTYFMFYFKKRNIKDTIITSLHTLNEKTLTLSPSMNGNTTAQNEEFYIDANFKNSSANATEQYPLKIYFIFHKQRVFATLFVSTKIYSHYSNTSPDITKQKTFNGEPYYELPVILDLDSLKETHSISPIRLSKKAPEQTQSMRPVGLSKQASKEIQTISSLNVTRRALEQTQNIRPQSTNRLKTVLTNKNLSYKNNRNGTTTSLLLNKSPQGLSKRSVNLTSTYQLPRTHYRTVKKVPNYDEDDYTRHSGLLEKILDDEAAAAYARRNKPSTKTASKGKEADLARKRKEKKQQDLIKQFFQRKL